MRSLNISTVLVILTAFTFGCTDQPLPTAPSEVPAAGPALNFMNGPANPGMSGVFRFQNVFLTFTTDPVRDLLVAHFQADDFVNCGGGSGFELADIHVVKNQEDIGRAISELVDAPIFIYQLSTFNGCSDFATGWVYSGTHTLRARDNDGSDAGPGANAFGWNGHGTVFDQGGSPYRYSEHQQAVILPNGNISFLVEDILVR